MKPYNENSVAVNSGDAGGHNIGLPLPIHFIIGIYMYIIGNIIEYIIYV
jgi:hypothetical protein